MHVGVRLLWRQFDRALHVDLVGKVEAVFFADAEGGTVQLLRKLVQTLEAEDLVEGVRAHAAPSDYSVTPLEGVITFEAQDAGVQEIHLAVQVHGALRDGRPRKNAPHYRITAHAAHSLRAFGLAVLDGG